MPHKKTYKKKFKTLIITIIIAFAITIVLTLIYLIIKPNSTLNLIQLSDTHIGTFNKTNYSEIESSEALFTDAVNTINKTKGVNYVLISGDLLDNLVEKRYKKFFSIAKTLKYPYYYAFGNHDFYNLKINSSKKAMAIDYNKKLNPNYIWDNTYYALNLKKDYRLIVLDSSIKKEDTANGLIDNKQLSFLDNELSNNRDKVIIIMFHHPIIPPAIIEGHELLNSNEVLGIINKYKNPIIILTGHYHRGRIVTSKEKKELNDNIVHISTYSMVTYPMMFRHIIISNYKNKIKIKINSISTTLSDIKEKNKKHREDPKDFEGSEKDKSNTIIIYKKFN